METGKFTERVSAIGNKLCFASVTKMSEPEWPRWYCTVGRSGQKTSILMEAQFLLVTFSKPWKEFTLNGKFYLGFCLKKLFTPSFWTIPILPLMGEVDGSFCSQGPSMIDHRSLSASSRCPVLFVLGNWVPSRQAVGWVRTPSGPSACPTYRPFSRLNPKTSFVARLSPS